MLHVDCDFYEPVVLTLETWYPKLSPGGFVQIDDYDAFSGCRQATDEFLADHPETRLETWGGLGEPSISRARPFVTWPGYKPGPVPIDLSQCDSRYFCTTGIPPRDRQARCCIHGPPALSAGSGSPWRASPLFDTELERRRLQRADPNAITERPPAPQIYFISNHINKKVIECLPYILALVVILWSMRDVKSIHFKHVDSTHHALNGAFVYDLVRTGNLAHPVAFGKQFYSRFPGITIPYHPPLFPFVEALFYSVFGVTFFAARLSVATAAGVVAFLMFRLVKSTHQSDSLAFAATISFMAPPISQYSAADVMLEFPALAFTLGALYCLRDLDKGYPWSRAYPFALLTAAAVWTKQHAVFLGLVPFIIILLQR